MKRVLGWVAIVLAVAGIAGYFALPGLFHAAGMHPDYDGVVHRMPPGSRALIVTTSHDVLGDTGRKTGVFSSELTEPYYAFLDGGMEVDVASIQGGRIPFDPLSFLWFIIAKSDKRAQKDQAFRTKVENSLRVDDVNFLSYNVIFLAGGWGAAYDMGVSDTLGAGITRAWAAGKVVGGVCHGPLGLLKVRDEAGEPLVRGRRLTAVTDRQVEQLGIAVTPMHPERDLRAAGALFEGRTRPLEILANHVVQDGRLVTGQNQNAGEEVAEIMMATAGAVPRER